MCFARHATTRVELLEKDHVDAKATKATRDSQVFASLCKL